MCFQDSYHTRSVVFMSTWNYHGWGDCAGMVRSLGSALGLRLLCPWPGTCRRIQGGELDHQLPPLPEQGGHPSTRRDLGAGGCWGKWRWTGRHTEVVHICWDYGRQHQRNWGARWHLEKGAIGMCQTLTRIVSRLVGNWGCMKSHELVRNGRQLLYK